MSNTATEILFTKDHSEFSEIDGISREFASDYSGSALIGGDIFSVFSNFSRKSGVDIQVLRFPFNDDGLWAFTFLKEGTVFLCINTGLALSKQLFAAAHELYHIYSNSDGLNQERIMHGSLVKKDTAGLISSTDSELDASAFAGLLLMPTAIVESWSDKIGIKPGNVRLDDILRIMEVFGLPYKATILRLYECGFISESNVNEFFTISQDVIDERISLTGLTKRWRVDGIGTESFGTLLDDFMYNKRNDLLTEEREKDDRNRIRKLIERYGLELKSL